MTVQSPVAQTAIDYQGLAELRRLSGQQQGKDQALRQVAAQFESMFVSMMLKSMRDASMGDSLLQTNHSDTYRELADKQLAMDLANNSSLGLQDAIIQQLGGQPNNRLIRGDGSPQAYSVDTIIQQPKASINSLIMAAKAQAKPVATALQDIRQQVKEVASEDFAQVKNAVFDSPASFVKQLWPMAKAAADKIGVSPDVILAQAALETGWGKHVIRHADGQSSFNLFNIKADPRWQGEFATKQTLEYRNGVAAKEQAKFRSYQSFQDSFNDYVEFLQTQPRYQEALQQTHDADRFIEGLHKAGYATDPNYADKIKRIMRGDTLAQISLTSGYS